MYQRFLAQLSFSTPTFSDSMFAVFVVFMVLVNPLGHNDQEI
jgi:hypothetical protein